MTLLYWEWHLIPRWLLGSIFDRFPEQLLKGLVSWGSPGKYSMIDCFLGDAFGLFSCPFWCIVLQCSARLPKLLDRAVSFASFLTGGMYACDLADRRSVAVLFMLYKIRCNPMHSFYGALTRCCDRTSVHLRTPSLQNLAVSMTFIPLPVSLLNDLGDPAFDGVGLAGYKSRAYTSLLA